jgi:hypothetical protein
MKSALGWLLKTHNDGIVAFLQTEGSPRGACPLRKALR